jgi:hypothetical protein
MTNSGVGFGQCRLASPKPRNPQIKTRRLDSLAGSASAPGFWSLISMRRYLQQRRAQHNTAQTARPAALDFSLPETAAGAFVHQRYRVPAAISDLIATLAGLGGNRDSLQ